MNLRIQIEGQADRHVWAEINPECWTSLSVGGHSHAILVVSRMSDGGEVKHIKALLAALENTRIQVE